VRSARQVGRVRYVRDDAIVRSFADALFGETDEPDVKIVEELLADAEFFVE
jgi:hypothetical protein